MNVDDLILDTISTSTEGSTLAELLDRHPGIARRTRQRWIAGKINAGRIRALGKGRARRYFATETVHKEADSREADTFPPLIPLRIDARGTAPRSLRVGV